MFKIKSQLINYLKFILPFVVISIYLSCSEKKIIYYPTDINYSENKLDIIYLDSLAISYDSLMDRFYSNYKSGNQTILEFESNTHIKQVKIISTYNSHIKGKNVLMITEDSIQKYKSYPIEQLKKLLRKHYFTTEQNDKNKIWNNSALINIALDTSISVIELRNNLTKSLINLTETFDEIKKETKTPLELYVFIDNLSRFPPPPPPSIHE